MSPLGHQGLTLHNRFAVGKGAVVRLVCAGVLLAVLLTQVLGFLHRVVHPDHGGMHASAQLEEVSSYAHPEVHTTDDFPWARLFGGHLVDADCRLYDQLTLADTLPGVPLVVLPVAWVATYYRPDLSAPTAAVRHPRCQARAPPLS
jgi:hypothetical protein